MWSGPASSGQPLLPNRCVGVTVPAQTGSFPHPARHYRIANVASSTGTACERAGDRIWASGFPKRLWSAHPELPVEITYQGNQTTTSCHVCGAAQRVKKHIAPRSLPAPDSGEEGAAAGDCPAFAEPAAFIPAEVTPCSVSQSSIVL